ncbi:MULTISPECIES: DUF2141 domain-containing protein [Bizionia]|uniref:DUF2141 domain-containing protein n=1 Tax=Bizionia algoritergicola TaxID=291187 RepID=A0A5D0QPT0_9FLAO|nr:MULTISPECIES: DUF2141 domain-containing protein [Bizionia]OBX22531.1 hypothetical protein BAA08_07900 [Bizionia sp. APA-3]TYB70721.1 DUF2141 domain-containing protein [Bizionia algoritergicola]
MKTLAVIIAFTLTSFISHAQDSLQTYTISVKVVNPLNNNGHVLIGLHTADTFMKADGIQSAKIKVIDGQAIASFENLKPGNYAVMVVHDENDNSRMDFEANGMPKESYGMSNNPMLMGPPIFNDAKFELKEDTEISIRF